MLKPVMRSSQETMAHQNGQKIDTETVVILSLFSVGEIRKKSFGMAEFLLKIIGFYLELNART